MKFTRSVFTLTGAVILLLSSLASIANAQVKSPAEQATVPCANNSSLGCTLFAAYDSNLASFWYADSGLSPQSNGLGRDPVFMYINGVLSNGTQSLTNSSFPTAGLWVGVVPLNTTVAYLGGQGDNSTSFGTCTNNIYPNTISGQITMPYGPPSVEGTYVYATPYSCH
jgi:hypothetical protein